MYLTFDFLKSREKNLEKLNRDKLGRRYAYPWIFIELSNADSCNISSAISKLEVLRKISEL